MHDVWICAQITSIPFANWVKSNSTWPRSNEYFGRKKKCSCVCNSKMLNLFTKYPCTPNYNRVSSYFMGFQHEFNCKRTKNIYIKKLAALVCRFAVRSMPINFKWLNVYIYHTIFSQHLRDSSANCSFILCKSTKIYCIFSRYNTTTTISRNKQTTITENNQHSLPECFMIKKEFFVFRNENWR